MPAQIFFPRPEYPRPDRQRGTVEGLDWLNLNGPWEFRFDPDDGGVEQQWFRPSQPAWREQILVPFCWESLAAWGEGDAAGNDHYYSNRVFLDPLSVNRNNHRSAPRYEIGWYRRTVEIPDGEPWKDKRIILTIGAADFFTDCWCNGIHLGHHEGGYIPFEFDLTDAIATRPGTRTALIVLRVEDPMDNSEQPVGKQWRWYTTTSGIWQTVYVEPRSATYIESFRIIPDIDAGTARFVINCKGGSPDSEVEIEISPPGAETQTEIRRVTGGVADQTVKLATLRLWEHNSPELYDVILRLRRDGNCFDTVRTYFGMRKIDFEYAKESGVPAAIRINNVARYLRGALYQSFYPDGVYTATSVETLRDDIRYAKKFGFNFLRIHIKVDDPLLLYWADKLGILLMADFPNFGEGGDTPLGRRRFETMMGEAIARDFNHPSIIAWCLFNETWGFGGQTGFIEKMISPPPQTSASRTARGRNSSKVAALSPAPAMVPAKVWVQSIWELAKKLDGTRLVEDMSVCHWDHLEYFQHCDTDINSWHFYMSDYDQAKAHIDKVVSSTFIGSSFNYVPGFLHKGQPLINSEYGGIGALDGDRDVSWSFKFLTNELRRHQQISAYIYTELHDVEWEYNGFLNYDRTPKVFGFDPRIINESNTLPIDAPPARKFERGEKVLLDVASSHFSTSPCENVSLHWELGGIDAAGVIRRSLASGKARIPFPHRKVAHAHTIELRLPETTMLCTLLIAARNALGETISENFVHYFVSNGYPHEREQGPGSLILRGHPAAWASAAWSGAAGERPQERADDACYAFGHGYFEWLLPLDGVDLREARFLKVICEASSRRPGAPQTDEDIFQTTLQLSLNDVPLYQGVLRNHPHDARGVLTYLRGGFGAYGYLVHAFAEGVTLQEIAKNGDKDFLRLRCAVPADAKHQGGLTIYGAECGRFPVCPTVIISW
jgi:hypothetical protein